MSASILYWTRPDLWPNTTFKTSCEQSSRDYKQPYTEVVFLPRLLTEHEHLAVYYLVVFWSGRSVNHLSSVTLIPVGLRGCAQTWSGLAAEPDCALYSAQWGKAIATVRIIHRLYKIGITPLRRRHKREIVSLDTEFVYTLYIHTFVYSAGWVINNYSTGVDDI